MRRAIFLLTVFCICCSINIAQVFDEQFLEDKEPRKPMMNTHDPNLNSFPEKSFYKQKADWQYIIDTTWGLGLPLAQKQQIFNTFTTSVSNSFDGFLSLGMTWESWDTLKNFYYSKINSTTSRGAFSAMMNYLCSELKDGHTYCHDDGIMDTPLNPGIPFLVTSGWIDTRHIGVVTTVLPDSTVLVLRVINNHPLNLEPGDIILGYEGVPWKYLLDELISAGLPNSDWWGGSNSSFTHQILIGAGMNWHLFDTMDVVKYSSGDTLHLSTAPLINLNTSQMLNNEQLDIPNIPFPNYFNGELVTYGILNNTNIGYIYVLSEWPSGPANAQFYQAILALQNTDAIIIDMRWNEGGFAFWEQAFKLICNETFFTMDWVKRCNPSNFSLCPYNEPNTCKITGSSSAKYDRPIAVLLGPTCASNGDINAYRLRYLYNVRTFGKPTWASLGYNEFLNISGWTSRYSICDMFHINDPGYYLNRREFPIDYPVWHNPDDVAQGKDAVVEKALWWISNLVYPHNTITDKRYYNPVQDTVQISTTIENPNSHQLSARGYFSTVEGVIIDSVNFTKQTLNSSGEQWTADYLLPSTEEIYKVSVTVFDETALDQFTVPNATRFTTAGPVVLDSISYTKGTSNFFNIKVYVLNQGITKTITDASVRLISNDNWISTLTPKVLTLPAIPPGETVSTTSQFRAYYVDSLFPGYFNFKVEVMSNNWPYWSDSMQVVVGVEKEDLQILTYKLEQNYPNPFNPSTKISWQSPVGSQQTIKVFDVLGNEVATLVNEYKPAGKYEVEFSIYSAVGRNLSSGVYFYQLRAGEYTTVKKMLLIK